ncbi:MAG: diaminopimelate epimerase [Thermodesulfobacteriota bacterium]
MKIPFYKMSGSGNDFIIIDNRRGILEGMNLPEWVQKVCRRGLSIGADGVILVEKSPKADFKWRFFNADGGEAEMCGNGGRCVARFASLTGISGRSLSFDTLCGVMKAEVVGERVKLRMGDPSDLRLDYPISIDGREYIVSSINTGVPHVVQMVEDLENYDVSKFGPAIRLHQLYQPDGTNANFIEVRDVHTIHIRTYERGVEDETLACGTGAVASALIGATKDLASSPVSVHPKSGEVLTVYFEEKGNSFTDIFLEGDARVAYEGQLWGETYGRQ